MLIGIVIAVFAVIILFDFIPCRKSRKKKENVFYGIVLAVSFCILALYSFGVTLPNPTKAIDSIVKSVVPIK